MRKAIGKFFSQLREKADYYDYNLLAVVILLTCFGLVMLYSTSAYEAEIRFGDDMHYFARQAWISLAAVLSAVVISKFDYHILIKLSGFIFLVSFVLMAMVKWSPLGVVVNGARRWLWLGIQFQPSEIAKIAVITYLPVVIISMGRKVKTLKGVLFLLLLGAIQAGAAYLLTDNLSTGLIIGGITVVMIFISHPKTKPFLITLAAGSVLIAIAVAYLALSVDSSESFRIQRILVWLHPEEYTASGGYQVMQALYAIGSGGFFGKGLGNSAQKLGTIPEAQNDMIFSIVCEELGIFGAVMLFAVVLLSFVPAVFYRPECAGSVRVFDGDGYFCPYCPAGYPEYLRGDQCDPHYGYYPSFRQLRRYFRSVSDGGDGNRLKRIQKD